MRPEVDPRCGSDHCGGSAGLYAHLLGRGLVSTDLLGCGLCPDVREDLANHLGKPSGKLIEVRALDDQPTVGDTQSDIGVARFGQPRVNGWLLEQFELTRVRSSREDRGDVIPGRRVWRAKIGRQLVHEDVTDPELLVGVGGHHMPALRAGTHDARTLSAHRVTLDGWPSKCTQNA